MLASLVPVPKAEPLREDERAIVARILADGARLFPVLMASSQEQMEAIAARIYRRFVLEALLALRATDGEMRANALARATRLRAQGFANKARELVAMDAVVRHALGGRPPGVAYKLTETGRNLGSLTFALTAYKSYQCLVARHEAPEASFPFPRLEPEPPPENAREVLEDAVSDADTLVSLYLPRRGGSEGAGALEVRRFAKTCVRRWHGDVLTTLAMDPRRFTEFRALLHVGDEALSRALRSLLALGAIRKADAGYEITPWGRGDLALGTTLVLSQAGALTSP